VVAGVSRYGVVEVTLADVGPWTEGVRVDIYANSRHDEMNLTEALGWDLLRLRDGRQAVKVRVSVWQTRSVQRMEFNKEMIMRVPRGLSKYDPCLREMKRGEAGCGYCTKQMGKPFQGSGWLLHCKLGLRATFDVSFEHS
jgi:hypothetical protein